MDMSETPTTSPAPDSEHAWVHEHLAAYLAGGLSESERQRFDAHINGCPACFDAFTEARDADRALLRTLSAFAPPASLEQHLTTHFRENSMQRWTHPAIRRTGYAAAAAVALAATGVFANYVIRQNGRLNNPLSQQLASDADKDSPELSAMIDRLTHALGRKESASEINAEADKAEHGAEQYRAQYGYGFSYDRALYSPRAPSGGAGADALALLDRRAKVDQLVADAKKLYDGTKFDEASSLLAQATTLDPADQEAKAFQKLVQDKLTDQQYQTATDKAGTEVMNQSIASAEHLIPYADLMVYPDNWPEITRARNGQQGVNGVLNYGDNLTVASGTLSTAQLAGGNNFSGPATDQNGRLDQSTRGTTGVSADGLQPLTGIAAGGGNATLTERGDASVRHDIASAQPDAAKNFGPTFGTDYGAVSVAGRPMAPAAGQKIANSGDGMLTPPEVHEGGKVENRHMLANQVALGMQPDAQPVSDQGDKEKDIQINGDLPELGKAFKRRPADVEQNLTSLAAGDPTAPSPTSPAQPAAATAPAPGAPPATTAPAIANQLKIIRNGTIEFEVRNFDDAYSSVAKIVDAEGGFVSSTSSDKLPNGHVRGTITVRVPPDHLDRFLLSLRALGDLKSQQISANDVTKEYTDTDSELRGLRTMETRLLDLIKNGKGEVKDLIEAETKLGETRIEIEKLEGQLKYYDNLVGMATITITAYEKDIQTPTAAAVQETLGINVETEEVETKYQAARKILDDAKGRIIESQLNNSDGEHIAAHIVAEVPPDKADFVSNQLRQLGLVTSFTRDRKQTTSGGTGAPPPGVQVEQKDTRVTMDLFNLANLAPRETTVLRIAVPDVEEAYRQALAQLRRDVPEAGGGAVAGEAPHPEGHIQSSNLTGQKPEQMSADVRAEIRADQADAFLALVRNSGEVLTSSVAANPDTAGSTAAKRGLQISFVNIAAVPPREVRTMTIAVEDVDKAYADLRTLLDKDAAAPGTPPGTQPATPSAALLPKSIGRITYSNINGQQPEQKIADIRAEIRSDQEDAVTAALASAGEVMGNSLTENPDAATTRIKRGLQVRFVNEAAVAARETVSLRAVAENVPDAYQKLTDALKAIPAANLRIVSSALNESNPHDVNATLAFEVSAAARAAVERAFPAAGIDFLSRTDASSTDTSGTLKSKIRFQVDQLSSAETLPPRRTFTLGEEVDSVETAMSDLRSFASTPPSHARVVEYNVSRESTGRTTGHIVLDFPADEDVSMLTHVRDLHGAEISNQLTANTQSPDTQHFNKERVDLTLVSKAGIVQSDKGLGQSIRAALSSATGALLYSLYLVLTGILFVLPFVLIVWPIAALARRRKTAT